MDVNGNRQWDQNSVDSGEGSIEDNDIEPGPASGFDVENDDGVVIEDVDEIEDGDDIVEDAILVDDAVQMEDVDHDPNHLISDNEEVSELPKIEPLLTFRGHGTEVYSCAIHPHDSSIAVTGGQDDKAFVWNLTTAIPIFECTGHSDSVISVAYSYDGVYLATGDMNGLIQIWKVPEKSPIWTETIDGFHWLLWHQESHILFAAQKTGEIFMWRIPSGQCKVFPGHGKSTESGAVTHDGKRLVVGYNDFSVKVFDLKTENIVATYKLSSDDQQEEEEVVASEIDVSPDNDSFAAGFTRGAVLIASSLSKKEYMRIPITGTVESVKFIESKDIPMLAIGSTIGVEIWDYKQKVIRFSVDCSVINQLLHDVSRSLLYAASSDGGISVIDTRSADTKFCFFNEPCNVYNICMSKDCKRLVAVCDNGNCDCYDLNILDNDAPSSLNEDASTVPVN